jgi:uncharacterized protein YecT (DUF1311 family)
MLRRFHIALAALLTPMMLAPFAHADDAEIIASCLKSALADNTDARQCIGRVANPCLDNPADQSTHGMVACNDRETKVWDDLLNTEYQRLLAAVEGKTKDDIVKAQRQWVGLRDMDCLIPYALFEGGTMAQPIGANCVLENTAERMLQVRAWREMMQPEKD